MSCLRKYSRRLRLGKSVSNEDSPCQSTVRREDLDNVLAACPNANTIYWFPQGSEGPEILIKRVWEEDD